MATRLATQGYQLTRQQHLWDCDAKRHGAFTEVEYKEVVIRQNGRLGLTWHIDDEGLTKNGLNFT